MWNIAKKEWFQFFNSLTGYIALAVFLLINGLLLFVFPNSSLLDFGYASLSPFFNLAPWVLLFLVPVVTMRSIAEEYKTGTFEILKTLPLNAAQIIQGKFIGNFLTVTVALVPTIIYAFSLQSLAVTGGIDFGSTAGSYLGLLLLAATYTAIGICASSFTNNTVIAFIVAAFVSLILFSGFDAISQLSFMQNTFGYYISLFGISFHYKSISRGVIDLRDIVYFISLIGFCLFLTQQNIKRR
jgi:ABC-2 type transport system permease protein